MVQAGCSKKLVNVAVAVMDWLYLLGRPAGLGANGFSFWLGWWMSVIFPFLWSPLIWAGVLWLIGTFVWELKRIWLGPIVVAQPNFQLTSRSGGSAVG